MIELTTHILLGKYKKTAELKLILSTPPTHLHVFPSPWIYSPT